ncbi:DUF6090 family protein [Xanthomarina spongicola]|uniref:Uncharacterized protein n=1 Tax=Xanthomarina spongicola TaxID=570520 RepID=A0A316DH76_9FLAO|nr:DUF6090 family protein [Xanthomarina spongicola]PWK17531.1 hypothetical protein LX78_02633 [Xanthomarina spongicola]
MIKFFRTIRRKLVGENRFNKPASPAGKYLLYAIGEIILVVIGILIALQINNWNTERQKSELEVKILKEIESNLVFDLFEIREDISIMDSLNLASKDIIEYLKEHDTPSEEFYYNVAKMKAAPHFNPNMSGYELLTSKGVEIVRSDSLRMSISDLYESYYPYYAQYEKERITFKSNIIQPFFVKHFNWEIAEDKFFLTTLTIPLEDFQNIKKEDDFLKIIRAAAFENSFVQLRAKTLEEKVIKLQELILKELMSKK